MRGLLWVNQVREKAGLDWEKESVDRFEGCQEQASSVDVRGEIMGRIQDIT